MLPKNLQTVITKNQNFIIPMAVFELILAKKPNVFGYAVQDGEGLSIGREEGTPELGDLETMNTETQGLRSLITFGWLDKGFNTEDVLPLVLNDGHEKPFMAIGLEGDFPKYDTNNGRTQEFNLANEIIIPTLLDICELTDGDIAKIMAALGKPSFNNNFLGAVGHRGVLSILPHEGDFVHLSKNELGEVYDWGTISQRHGFGDAVQEIVEKADEVKKPRFSFGKKTAAPQDVATPGTAPRASVPAVHTNGATTVKDVKKVETKTQLVSNPIRPPEWCHNNDDKRSWYQMVCGNLPKGWKNKIPVIPTEGVVPPAKIEDLTAWRANRAKSTIAAAAEQKPAATATTAGAPKSGAEVKAIRAEENAPIIGAAKMEKILDLVTKHIDGQSVEMKDPKTIQSVESKFVEFSASVASTPQETVNWPVSFLFALGNTDIAALVAYAVEHRAGNRMRMEEKGLMAKPEPAKATTTVTKTGDTTKVESVSNEVVAPKKSGKFSFGKKAA